jgi:hypothetical protein
MPTGACGIDCDVCQLKLQGVCSTCGAGTSAEGELKLEAQQRILGSPCPILACARLKRVAYCLRDCGDFPCANFTSGPYPFSPGYLEMQQRRRRQPAPDYAPDGSHVRVAAEYWSRLEAKDALLLCNHTLFNRLPDGQLMFRFLNEDVRVDVAQRCLRRRLHGEWSKSVDPLLELTVVLYLAQVRDIYPLGRDIVGPKDLKEGHFFQGPHELKIAPLLARYGKDVAGFRRTAERHGGQPVPMAGAAYRLNPFPRVPLYYLLWEGDAEFPARMSILFERSIEECLAADAIWGLVTRVSSALLG